MPRALGLALALAAAFVAGCFETKRDITLNPDGAGKVTIDSKLTVPDLGLGEAASREKAARDAVRDILKKSEGVDAWKNVKVETLPDGQIHFQGTAYFRSLDGLKLQNMQLLEFEWIRSEDGRGILTTAEPPETTGDEPEMTEEEIQAAIAKERLQFQTAKAMMGVVLGAASDTVTFHLPGKAEEVVNFKKTDEAGAVTLGLTGAQLLSAMDALMQDDTFVRKAVLAKKKPGGGEPGGTFPPEAYEKLFGTAGPVRAVVTGLAPRFDWEAEVAEAKKNFPTMLREAGLADVVPAPPAKGQGFERLEVGGLRLVWIKGTGRVRPFGEDPGFTVALVGRLPGSILEVQEGRVTRATTDTGQSLLPESDWDRKIHFPRLGEDGRTVAFEAELAMPPTGAKAIQAVEGVLEYQVAAGTKVEDLGLVDLKVGALGGAYGVSIVEIGPSERQQGKQTLVVKLDRAPAGLKAVRLQDAKGTPIETDETGRMTMNETVTIDLTHAGGFPAKGRIVLELHKDLKRYEVPWKIENVPLPKRPGK